MELEKSIKIKEVIDLIHERKYVLPAIQREFIWKTEQIESLFDSLMQDYPIGSFLFWSIEKENTSNFQFYEFIYDYHQRDQKHNPKFSVNGNNSITAILDGQQRLTSLYIGLLGSYAYKMPNKRWDNDLAFPNRKLYLNLVSPNSDSQGEYNFRFLTKNEAKERTNSTFWFPVTDIYKIREPDEANEYLFDHDLNSLPKEKAKFANKTIFKFQRIIHEKNLINYFLEKNQSLDKVLNIFIRANSGGTKLSYSDLLLSIATAKWKNSEAREVITSFVDELNRIGDGFEFDKDFVLKSCLVLSDIKDISFKVDNFNVKNMDLIEKKWDEISGAIRETVTLASNFGFNGKTLTSKNALIPIAYYLQKSEPKNFVSSDKNEIRKERDKIFKWLLIVLLKRTFGGQSDNILRSMRSEIEKHYKTGFPLKQISETLKGTQKSIIFTNDEIENLLELKYGKGLTFSALAILYQNLDFRRNKFEQDHIFPRKFFTIKKLPKHKIPESKIEFYMEHYDSLTNLQLLGKTPNQEKSGKQFEDWLNDTYKDEQECAEYIKEHFIPQGISLSLNNFEEFVTKRKALLVSKFEKLLKI